MSGIPNSSTAGLLHVRPSLGRSVCADDMDTRLESTGLSVDTCFDVYRGLARVCKDADHSFQAIVLCMDVLGSSELEFFSVIARARPDLPVYIYGETAEGSRKAVALQSGDVSDATDELIDRLAGASAATIQIDTALDDRLTRISEPEEANDVSAEEPDAVDDVNVQQDPIEPVKLHDEPIESVEPLEPVEDAEPELDDEGDDRSVQVPWLSRGASPARRGPGERSRADETPPPGRVRSENAPMRGPHEPLLTSEELRALMGDDLPEASPADPFDEGERL